MSSFAIVTDSTANLPKAFLEKQGIYVLPLTWISGEKEYSGRQMGTERCDRFELVANGDVELVGWR